MSSLSDASQHLCTTPPLRLATVGGTLDDGSLVLVDDLLATYARREQEQAAHMRAVLLERERFTHAAACRFEHVVKPTFWNVAERLNDDGGGGLVEEQTAASRHGQRVTLWMSLEGPVAVPPRVDRNPHIQLEVDVAGRRITVWEGDMWRKLGASRRTEPFTLEQLTPESVLHRAVGVVRRTVNHGDTERGAQ